MPSNMRRSPYGIAKYARTDEDALRELREMGIQALNTADQNGRTPLMKAAIYGSRQTIERLLTAGADIHGRGSKDGTVLHAFVWKMRMKMDTWMSYRQEDSEFLISHFYRFLIDKGADPTWRGGDGNLTPSEYAGSLGMDDEFAMLRSIEDAWMLRKKVSGASRNARGGL